MFDPDANIPQPNRSLIYFGACIIAGLRLARERPKAFFATAVTLSFDTIAVQGSCIA
jgi:hypothetical protein